MARFRDIHLYPYSGWYRKRWGQPDTRSRDVDATARTARRVTEAISRELGVADLSSSASSYRLIAEEGKDTFELTLDRSPSDAFLGRLTIPRGFRHLDPQVRAGLVADAVQAALLALGDHSRWDPAVVRNAVDGVRDASFACEWTGPWKASRDRSTQIRLQGRILDDGYGRWRIVVADRPSGAVRLQTQDVVGWNWLANLERAAASIRWVTPSTIELQSGSDFLPQVVTVNIETGKVKGTRLEPVPTSYPGAASRAPSVPTLLVH